MSKGNWCLDSLLESFTILHMTCKVRNSAVKNILKCMLSKELITKNPHAPRIFEVYP